MTTLPRHRDLLNIRNVYYRDNTWAKFCNNIKDRFGFWGVEQLHPLPHEVDETLDQASIQRCKELGKKTIMWSGGVDSTYIVCAYIKSGVPFDIVCDESSLVNGEHFYKWLIVNGYKPIVLPAIEQCYKMTDLIHGDVADLLFAPDEYRRIKPMKVPIRDAFTEQQREWVDEYGKLLKKPTVTNNDIIRLISFGTQYFLVIEEVEKLVQPKYGATAFFGTDLFSNVAYTRFWDALKTDNKPEMHQFICDVTQDGDMWTKVYRLPTNIQPRVPLLYGTTTTTRGTSINFGEAYGEGKSSDPVSKWVKSSDKID